MVPPLVPAGVPILIADFAMNHAPSPGAAPVQVTTFGATHVHSVRLGGWFQVMGTVMASIFALCVVVAAGSATRLPGLLTLFGITVLVTIGLAEMTGYGLVTRGDPAVVNVGAQFITAVQRGYTLVAAPLLFVPLGSVILRTNLLSRALGWTAVILGGIFFVFGFLSFVAAVPGNVDVRGAAQGIRWLAAGINRIRRAGQESRPLAVEPCSSASLDDTLASGWIESSVTCSGAVATAHPREGFRRRYWSSGFPPPARPAWSGRWPVVSVTVYSGSQQPEALWSPTAVPARGE